MGGGGGYVHTRRARGVEVGKWSARRRRPRDLEPYRSAAARRHGRDRRGRAAPRDKNTPLFAAQGLGHALFTKTKHR